MTEQVSFYNYDPEEEALKRKQALLDAMQMKALQSAPQAVTVSGMGAAPSKLSGLLQGLNLYLSQRASDKLGQERQDLALKKQADLRAGLEAYDKASRDRWEEPGADQAGPPQFIKGDRRKAIFDALASQHPLLQKLGMSQLEAEGKGALTAKDLLPYASRQGITNMVQGGLGGFQPKRDIGEVGGIVYDKDNLQTMELGGPKPTQQVVNGDLYELNPSTGQWKKLDNAPKISNTTNVSLSPVIKGESKFMEGIGTAAAQDAIQAKQAKVHAQRTIQSMDKLEQLDRQGVFSGPTANLAMTVGSLADALGVPVDKAKLSNSQAYQGELMGQLSNQLTGSLARSTTDKDMEILKAPLPQLLNSPEGRAALRRQAKAKAEEQIQYANQVQMNLATQYPEAGRLFEITPGQVPVPQRSDVQPGGGAVRRYNPATGRIE